jgi:hypothetical protein
MMEWFLDELIVYDPKEQPGGDSLMSAVPRPRQKNLTLGLSL